VYIIPRDECEILTFHSSHSINISCVFEKERLVTNRINGKLFVGCLLVFCLIACGKSDGKKADDGGIASRSESTKPDQSGSATVPDSGLKGMVAGIVEQAEKQGAKFDLSQNQDALVQVIKLYLIRPDLQQAYGGPVNVDLSGLIQWANVSGVAGDADKDKLAPYAAVLSPLAEQLSKTTIRVKLEWR
jgi:hypothetical protein